MVNINIWFGIQQGNELIQYKRLIEINPQTLDLQIEFYNIQTEIRKENKMKTGWYRMEVKTINFFKSTKTKSSPLYSVFFLGLWVVRIWK